MSANQYRSQLERKRKQRVDAESKAGSFRARESTARAAAASARQAASRTKNESTARSKLREAERKERDAVKAGKDAASWQAKATAYAKDEEGLRRRLEVAEKSEAQSAERRRQRTSRTAARREVAERASLVSRIDATESAVRALQRELPAPEPEKLRVLILGAASEGDLRVGREIKRIRAGVESALHRDQIELDGRPAATTEDLLSGLTRFRPHIVHFSGHSNDDLIVFEDELDAHHEGVVVTAAAFASAVAASDKPPVLVLLNSCRSASQIDELVRIVVPFAIGMSDSIDDADAIGYAAWFYTAIADGQSIAAAHRAGRSALQLAGLPGADLPTLAAAAGFDADDVILVKPTP